MKGNDSTAQGKTKHSLHKHKDKSLHLKHIKRQTKGPARLYELFLLTHWRGSAFPI